MGNSTEEGKTVMKEKSPPPPATVMNNCHVYPDWAAVQAFYGPRFAMPPYSNSPVASSPTTPHYMRPPPQSMIAPYTAFYAPYPHPGVPMVGATMDSPAKSTGNSSVGFLKKHKEVGTLAISIGNGSVDDNDTPTEHRSSESDATDGSSHGSNGGTARAAKGHRKRSHQCFPNSDVKVQTETVFPITEIGRASDKSVDAIDAIPSDAPGEKIVKICTALDLKNLKPSPSGVLQPISSETWLQNERELKREKRKQSNRESARRSRLRKQAETEELADKVQALISDNMNMRSEISNMMEKCKKLKFENAVLMGKLNDTRSQQTNDDVRLNPTIGRLKTIPPLATVNLLERVNNSEGGGDRENDDGEVYKSRNSPVKLHQLLDASH